MTDKGAFAAGSGGAWDELAQRALINNPQRLTELLTFLGRQAEVGLDELRILRGDAAQAPAEGARSQIHPYTDTVRLTRVSWN